jgi:hypothetical protein
MERSFYTRPVLRDRERDRRSSPALRPGGEGEPAQRGLVCAACSHRITDRIHAMAMSGAHEHTFVNPGGYQFHIGCFRAAPGCVHLGVPEQAFSWFPGWTWQIAACGRCRAHLGWIYRLGNEQFHGLVIAALREDE